MAAAASWRLANRLGYAYRQAKRDFRLGRCFEIDATLDQIAESLFRLRPIVLPDNKLSVEENLARAPPHVSPLADLLKMLAMRPPEIALEDGEDVSSQPTASSDPKMTSLFKGKGKGKGKSGHREPVLPGPHHTATPTAATSSEQDYLSANESKATDFFPPQVLTSLDILDDLTYSLIDEYALAMALYEDPPPPPQSPFVHDVSTASGAPRRAQRAVRRRDAEAQRAISTIPEPDFLRDNEFLRAEAAFEEAVSRGEYDSTDFSGFMIDHPELEPQDPLDDFSHHDVTHDEGGLNPEIILNYLKYGPKFDFT